MLHKRLTISALIFLLIAGSSVAACTPVVSGAPDTTILIAPELAQAIPIPGWQQANISGFGDPREQEVSALESFNGYLYAGTYNLIDPLALFDGARIFRSPDGVTWTPVTQPGFQNPHDTAPPAILDFVVFGNRLYASTGRGGNPAQIWRSSTGTIWAPMVNAGFGDPDIHEIAALAVFSNMIYAGAGSQVSGAKIYRSSSGDSNTWNPVAPAASTIAGASVTEFAIFNGMLYATIESEAPVQIWRTSSAGGAWTSVMTDGFGNSKTSKAGGMAVFGGYLYVGTGNDVSGAQLWHSNDGASWAPAITPGFGDPNNKTVEMVFVFQNQLYVGVQNDVTGLEIWRSADGSLWEQVNQDGFGDSKNTTTNGTHPAGDFMSQLYVGTSNIVEGGELWRMLQPVIDTPTTTATDTPTATPTFTHTATATLTPTDIPVATQTPTATQIPTDTPTATATFTNTPSATATQGPTNTATTTPTATTSAEQTLTETLTATQTPTDMPTIAPTPTPILSTPGKVSGGGVTGSDHGGDKITFGLVVSFNEGDSAPKGNLTFQDHKSGLRLKATSFDLLVIEENHVWFTGTGAVNGQQEFSFIVDINALKEQGLAGTFHISILELNGYTAGGTMTGGSINIHQVSNDQLD